MKKAPKIIKRGMSLRERWSAFGIDGFVPAIVLAVLFAFLWPRPGAHDGPLSLKVFASYGIALVFFIYGLKLDVRQLITDLSNWKLHLTIQLSTFVCFPVLILLVQKIFGVTAGNWMWLGIFYLACLPSTVSSSVVMVSIARGNVPSAIFNASFSSLAGVFITPLWMSLVLTTIPGNSALSGIIMKLIVQILLPLSLGLVLHHWWGAFAQKYSKRLRYYDQAVILLIIYTAFSESFEQRLFEGFGFGKILALGVGMVVLFFVVYLMMLLVSRWLRFNREDTITALFCGSKKSLMHGTVMSKVLFPASMAGLVLLPLMLYHALQLLIVGFIASSMAKHPEKSPHNPKRSEHKHLVAEPSVSDDTLPNKNIPAVILEKMRRRRWITAAFLLLLLAMAWGVRRQYLRFFGDNVTVSGGGTAYLYIPTGADYPLVKSRLSPYVTDLKAFDFMAGMMDYGSRIKPGKYALSDGMSQRRLLVMLRGGRQTPVNVTFNSIRTRDQFCGVIARQIEADSLSLLLALNDTAFNRHFQIDSEAALTLFIPNTYEFYWNTSAQVFVRRMAREYNKFWTPARMERLASTGLTRTEVSILASIVEEETRQEDEKPIVAGLYINRLRRGMLLQADPTVKFAWGDFTLRRILNRHLGIKSPYNTYRYPGLPPGPICMPSVSSIDAVLNYTHHKYVYFCAREDFSGYHNFAATLPQHMRNARRYQAALNKLEIK